MAKFVLKNPTVRVWEKKRDWRFLWLRWRLYEVRVPLVINSRVNISDG